MSGEAFPKSMPSETFDRDFGPKLAIYGYDRQAIYIAEHSKKGGWGGGGQGDLEIVQVQSCPKVGVVSKSTTKAFGVQVFWSSQALGPLAADVPQGLDPAICLRTLLHRQSIDAPARYDQYRTAETRCVWHQYCTCFRIHGPPGAYVKTRAGVLSSCQCKDIEDQNRGEVYDKCRCPDHLSANKLMQTIPRRGPKMEAFHKHWLTDRPSVLQSDMLPVWTQLKQLTVNLKVSTRS